MDPISQAATPETEKNVLCEQQIITDASTPQIEEIITEDGILSSILSFLTVKEAVRTSVLSSRWRRLWTTRTKFRFDAVTVLNIHSLKGQGLSSEKAYDLTEGQTDKFILSVNTVLQQLQGARIDEFKVSFFLDKSHSHHIDAWVRLAVARRAKKVGINLCSRNLPLEPYVFQFQLLGSSPSIELLTFSFCSIKLPCNFNSLRHLQNLGFANVKITEEDLNSILSNCSSTLLSLSVWGVAELVSLSIREPLSQLRRLSVQGCDQLRKIDISAVNLVTLQYIGVPTDFKFRQSSKLIKAGRSKNSLEFYLTKLSSDIPNLHCLSLTIDGISRVGRLPKHSSMFFHLMHFIWKWNGDGLRMSLLHIATLLNAAPVLKELNLRFLKRVVEQPPQPPMLFREMPKSPAMHLKTVKISGFHFDVWQMEIAAYVLYNASELESMTIEKGSEPSWCGGTSILNKLAPGKVKWVVT